jgi:hypothetical protein
MQTLKKTKQIILNVLFIGICIFLSNCEEEKPVPHDYPRVKTLPVSNITEEGAVFSADLYELGTGTITEYGFEWGITAKTTNVFDNKIKLNYLDGSELLSYDVRCGLYSDTLYSVRAFIATEKYLVHGNIVSFRSSGSNPPIIVSFLPKEGTWGDTIKIKGRYFSEAIKNIQVSLGSFNSTIISNNDTTIICIVPDNIPDKTVPILVTVTGKQTQSKDSFYLISPFIESISPQQGTFDDLVTITGKDFSPIVGKNEVKFNNIPAQVIQASKTMVIVKVPREIRNKVNNITISVNLQLSNSNILFNILKPEIYSLSPASGFTGSNIQINGNNFNPQLSGNIILSGTKQGVIQSSSRNTIIVKLPSGIYITRSFPIEVKVGDQNVFTENFTLLDPWIRKADIPHNQFGRHSATAFSLNGMGYVGLGDGYVGSNFWKYDPLVNEWSQITPFPGSNRQGAASFVIGDKGYVGGGGTDLQDFWSYDPILNSWTRVADFPGINYYRTYGFSVNGKGYVVARTPSSNFWEYDAVSDKWTQKKDFPISSDAYPFYPDAGFIINNKIYIYSADGTTADNQLWEYDINSDTWTRKADVFGSYLDSWTTGFSANGNGYIRGEEYLFKYNPTLDSWTILPQNKNIPGGSGYRGLSISFKINELVYFGTSFAMYGTDQSTYDLWEFNSNYE